MLRLLVLTLVVFACFVAHASGVPCGVIVVDGSLTNDTNAFVGCTSALSVSIQHGNPDLSGLASLVSITDYVHDSPCGTIVGLCITQTNLTSLRGLHSLTTVVYQITLSDNSALVSLDGLNALTSVGAIPTDGIRYNMYCITESTFVERTSTDGTMPAICPHDPLHEVNPDSIVVLGIEQPQVTLVITGNGALGSLDGLDALTVKGPITISNNRALTSMSGLNPLLPAASLLLQGNNALRSLVGWAVKSIKSLTILNNLNLASLSGLETLVVVQSLVVTGNPLLVDASGLTGLRHYTTASIGGPQLCCPTHTVYTATSLPHSVWQCVNCFQLSTPSLSVAPTSGGLSLTVPFQGAISHNPVLTRFRVRTALNFSVTTAATPCQVQSVSLLCTLPPLPDQFEIALPADGDLELSLDGLEWSAVANQSITYAAFLHWANLTETDEFASAVNGSSTYSISEAPGIPASRTSTADSTALILIAVMVSLGGAFLLFGLLALCTPLRSRFEKYLSLLDGLFLIRTRPTAPPLSLMLRETSAEGGIFTAASVVIVVGVLSAYLSEISIDNTLVLKSVDPSPNSAIIASDYAATVTFTPVREFTGNQATAVPSRCIDWFEIGVSGFSSQGVASCAFDAAGDAVTVEWSCARCKQVLSNGNVSISVPAANAFTRSLRWSFSAVDYFGSPSRVSGVMTADAASYFKGAASVVQLSALSTNYTDHSSPTRTGKLMKVLAALPGAQVQDRTFGAGFGVALEFNVVAAPDWFVIQITQKLTALSILAQVLAILSGGFAAGRLLLALYCKLFKRDPMLHAKAAAAAEDKSVEMIDIRTVPPSDAEEAVQPNPLLFEQPAQ